ncbi:uncharacterized protein LOC132869142 [Neoarius graeffei]|uniref:uncharacterized protein LOC132869142 n=1 Tax=Neoarius graeffei TaxID=443677 RepID=UPI00298C0269|nr:uncharacterized protein LOC132869142 [Neoarius graeffei]
MRQELQQAYQLATETATKNHLRNKSRYDQRVRDQPLAEGDRVLVRNVGLTGKHKLQDRWKSTPYVVIKKLPNLPVYRVRPEYGNGGVKTLHRDHLLPIGYLVRMPNPSLNTESIRKPPVTRMQDAHRRQKPHLPLDQWSHVSSCSESEFEDVHECQFLDVDEVRRVISTPRHQSGNHSPSEYENSELSESEPELEQHEESTKDVASHQSENEEVHPSDTAEDTDVEPRAHARHNYTMNDMPRIRKSQREKKPAIRLTYDKPGHSTEEPVTIVHHGMVIQLTLSSQDREVKTPVKNYKCSQMSRNKSRTTPAQPRCKRWSDEDI